MESSPITSWPIEGEQLDKVTDFLFLGPKITVDVDCIQKIGRWLFLGRKWQIRQNTLDKNKDITLMTEVHVVKPINLWQVGTKMFPFSRYEDWGLIV